MFHFRKARRFSLTLACEILDMYLKNLLLGMLPGGFRLALRRLRVNLISRKYRGLPASEVFSKIYQQGAWGGSSDSKQPFYSGTGSHDTVTVDTYVKALADFLQSIGQKPAVVDVGCGDFNVGSRIRAYCSTYMATDVVPALIEYNRVKFAALVVDFQVLDITSERARAVDVIFIRQVLQHLSNAQILAAIANLQESCRFLVVTEHLPAEASFQANLDKPAGPDIRSYIGSGVVLSLPPFNMAAKSVRELCRVRDTDGFIVTTAYEFSDR